MLYCIGVIFAHGLKLNEQKSIILPSGVMRIASIAKTIAVSILNKCL